MDLFLYDRDLRHELTTLNNNFTEPEVKKENKFSRHVILISHLYVATFMSVSVGL